MEYITGLHALNIECGLDTCGDWHQSAIQWDSPWTKESRGSIYGEYGIESGRRVPAKHGTHNVADHIRAVLDLLEQGDLALAQGLRDGFICNGKYTVEIFQKVSLLEGLPHWGAIDEFMQREYRLQWLEYKEGKNNERMAKTA
ncbi:MAG: hypothetical protein FWH32_03500 [Clostridiales bacterium]|nr:hypothetical protein [Clostridiales bacterium]